MTSSRRTLATIFLIVFTDLIGFGIVIPLLPLYAEHYHPAPWVFGLLMASFSAMQFLFSPILGRLSDRIGRRPVLVLSLAGSLGGALLFALADSLVWLFAARLLAGVCGGNIGPAQAVIADSTPRAQRAKGMGLIGAAFGLGFIAGPALAGVLLPLGSRAPGFGAAAFSLAALVMTLLFLPETRTAAQDNGDSTPRSGFARIAWAWQHRELGPVLVVGFLAVLGFAGFEVTFAQFVHARLGLSRQGVSFLFVYVGVMAAVVQGGLIGPLSRRFGEARLALVALLLTAAGLVGLAMSHTMPVLLCVLPILSLGAGLTTPALSALVSGAAGDEQGAALGAFQGVGALARVIGPFAAEIAFGGLGVAAPALGAGVLALLASSVMWLRRAAFPGHRPAAVEPPEVDKRALETA